MTGVSTTVAEFEAVLDQAESVADDRPRADLAGYQLQALTTTIGQLAGDDGQPPEIEGALETIRSWLGTRAGSFDRSEAQRLKDKVAALLVVADEVGLDEQHLADLLTRWEHAVERPTSSRSGPARGRRKGATGGLTETADRGPAQTCPVCGLVFKRVAKHLSSAHPEEWARQRQA
jgi:hypothetical protein